MIDNKLNGSHFFECTDCGCVFSVDQVEYLCPECSSGNSPNEPPKGVLKTCYHYDKIAQRFGSMDGFDYLEKHCFLELLPIVKPDSLPNLRIGNTPLYKATHRDHTLYFKDDSVNPTYSLKDRASGLVSAIAKERGKRIIVAASTGNAGSSLAGICAAQRQKAVVLVPARTPRAKLVQIAVYGGIVVPVEGTYDDAFELSKALTRDMGWYNRNTAYNPYTIEGKKTVSFEIYSQLHHHVPDNIFVPVGDGVIMSGVYRGFEDLRRLGAADNMPRLYAVQSRRSDNLVRNLENEVFATVPSTTLADSISVDVPRNFRMAKSFLIRYGGKGITVSDEDVLSAARLLSRNTGLFAEPAAAAAYAGYLAALSRGEIQSGSRNVVLLTGSGLKDVSAFMQEHPKSEIPEIGTIKGMILEQLGED